MTKEDAEKKIKEILDKDPRYRGAAIKIIFRDKKTIPNLRTNHTLHEYI